MDLTVGLGEALDLGLQLTGAALPRPQLELSVDLRGVDPGALARVAGAQAPPGAFAGGLRARVEAPASPCALAGGCPEGPRPWALGDLVRLRPADLTATLSAACPGCSLPPVGPFSLAVDGALHDGAGQARVRLEALGVSVLADAALDRALDPTSAALQARWQITAPRVDRAARLAGVAATGALDTGGTCTGDLARLRCRGELSLRAVSAQGIRLSQADLRYTVAPLAQPLGFEADLSLAGLRAPGVPHPISARLGVRGTPAALALTLDGRHGPDRLSLALDLRPGPPLEVRLRRLRGQAQGVAVALAAPARITRSAAGVIQLTPLALELLGGRLRVAGRFDPAGRNDLKLSVADLELARLAPFVPKPALGGRLDLDTHLQGTLAAAQVDLSLALAGLRLDGHGLGDVRLTTALSPQRLAVSLGLTQGPERAVGVELDLPVVANLARGVLRPRLEASGSADLRLRGLTPAWLGPLAPLPPDLDFALEGEARVAGRVGRWASTTDLRGRVAAAGLDAIPFQLALAAEPGAQRLTLEAAVTPPGGSQPLPLQLSAEAAVDLEALARGAPLDRSAPLSGRLVVPPIPLASLAGLLPASLHGPEGRLAVDLRVAGSLADPMPVGRVDLEGGAVTVLALGQRLTGVTAGLAIDGRRITLERLDFKAAEGRGSLTGGGGLAADGALDGALALRLKRFPVLAPGAPPLRIDSRIDVTLAQPPGGVLGVVVTIKGTDVELLKLAGGGPRAIPDHPRITWASDPPPAPATDEAPPPTPIEISVRIPEPLRIFGRILDMSWTGRLDLRLGPDPQMSGALSAQGGFVELLSNRFELTEGEITLAPGATPTPFMRIEARTETAEGVVKARIRGSAGAPSLSFSSEPPLEESEILTLLVTGSTTAGEDEKGDVRAEAAALFATFQAPAFEAALQEKLGVDRVRLTFGEGGLETPILSFGKHVTRRLYVEARYRPNPTEHENETELSARLRLRQRWTLESRYGDLGLGDLGVFWDVPLPRDRPDE